MYLDELLNSKWEIDKENDEGKIYCEMPEISEETHLHELCKKIDIKYYEDLEKAMNIQLLPELKEFYKYYNGCRLFLQSIGIYGIHVEKSFPFELFINDQNKHASLINNGIKDELLLNDIVFCGVVGDYQMYYKQSEISNPKIYLSKEGSLRIDKEFSSIRQTLEYYLKYLIPEYNEKGYRNHPVKDKWCRKYPALYNKFFGDIDWDVSENELDTKKKD